MKKSTNGGNDGECENDGNDGECENTKIRK